MQNASSSLAKGALPLAAGKAASIAFAVALTAAFGLFLLDDYGWKKAGLGLAAVAVGIVFFRSQFGFSYTWRVFILQGDGRGLRAQMLWIALAILPFALLTGAVDALPAQAAASVRPLSVGVVIGALLFGIGMQTGGACTSGAIVNTGQGSANAIVSLTFFVAGALFAASHISHWTAAPALPPFSFFREWGVGGAFALMALAGAVAAATFLRQPRGLPSAPPPPDRMPLKRAAVWLAALSVLLLLFGGQPWGVVYGMTLLGGKILLLAGAEDVEFWDFWQTLPNGDALLRGGWLEGAQMTTATGMLLGVFAAAIVAQRFVWRPRRPDAKRMALAAFGGALMGYGALISYGCNIGAYISALSSGSAHGWLWLAFAFAGGYIGVGLRRAIGLDK